MIGQIEIRGRVKDQDDTDKMLTEFRNEIQHCSIGDMLDNSPYCEVDSDIDDSDGLTSSVTITYGIGEEND